MIANIIRVIHVYKMKFYSKRFKYFSEHPVATAIQIIGRNDFITGTQHFDNCITGPLSATET